jgi:hemerythrin superfamily protein
MKRRPETMRETDAVELLIRQHEEIRRLLRKVETSTGDRRAEAFDRLRRLLAVHETAEEEVIHPLARRAILRGDHVIQARLDEERKGKQMLRRLEKMGTSAPSFEPMFARFRTAVLKHAEREEREEFPALRTRGDAELRGLAAAVKAAEAMAPTHPHPGVESARKNLMVGLVVAVADRVRDITNRALGRDHR